MDIDVLVVVRQLDERQRLAILGLTGPARIRAAECRSQQLLAVEPPNQRWPQQVCFFYGLSKFCLIRDIL